jgi:tetratricopeptide (TPR) repeat protein
MATHILLSVLVTLNLLPATITRPRTSALAVTLQTNSNSISGHVSNDQRMPLADLRVELLNEVDSVIRTVKTDGSGLFIFRKLSDGTFQVRVQTSGTNYVSQTKRVELARPHGFGAAFEELDFVLVMRNNTGSTPKPGVVFVQEVKSAIDLFPQYFDALEMLGTEQVKDRDYEAAIPALTKALQINSRAYASSFALGVAQYNLKQLQPAVESFRRAVLLNEKSINANLWLGIALRQTSQPGEAEPYLKRADVLADSKLPDAHWQLALLYNQLKRYKEAADELETFLKVQPDARDVELIKKLIQRFRQQSVAEKPE